MWLERRGGWVGFSLHRTLEDVALLRAMHAISKESKPSRFVNCVICWTRVLERENFHPGRK